MVMPGADMVLAGGFAGLVKQLLHNCHKRGITMVPYQMLRTPRLQAHYWKRGRTQEEAAEAIRLLKNNQAFFLAHCLEEAGTKHTNIVTHALPGCSWHQWGEAIDCYWLHNGIKVWDLHTRDNNGLNGYSVYAGEAKKLGLEAGYYWTNLADAVHVQLRAASSPLELYTLTEINRVMEETFT